MRGGPTVTPVTGTTVLDDDLRPVEPGSGTIGRVARSGYIPIEYLGDPTKTAETFLELDGTRYVIPGDLATVEADGSLTLLGRGSQSINSGGEKIFPEEVEAAVKSHPAVYDALVVGVPDERWGQRVAAVVQPRPGTTPSLESVQEHCRARIAGYKIPASCTSWRRCSAHPAASPTIPGPRRWPPSAPDGEPATWRPVTPPPMTGSWALGEHRARSWCRGRRDRQPAGPPASRRRAARGRERLQVGERRRPQPPRRHRPGVPGPAGAAASRAGRGLGCGGFGNLPQPVTDPVRVGDEERLPERSGGRTGRRRTPPNPRTGRAGDHHRPRGLHEQGGVEDLDGVEVALVAEQGGETGPVTTPARRLARATSLAM